MGDVVGAIRTLGGAATEIGAPGHLPIQVHGGPLAGGGSSCPGDTSSQFLSGLLLAGPAMRTGLEIRVTTELVSRPYVDMTIAVMAAFGAHVGQPAPDRFVVEPGSYCGDRLPHRARCQRGLVRVRGRRHRGGLGHRGGPGHRLAAG